MDILLDVITGMGLSRQPADGTDQDAPMVDAVPEGDIDAGAMEVPLAVLELMFVQVGVYILKATRGIIVELDVQKPVKVLINLQNVIGKKSLCNLIKAIGYRFIG
ncbi:hypothetical protein AAE02nite_32200 [Adhaeribacter aerolatus]|uniref:Uncharacterized protein n=1 Tax=Adhaeribacter aerolatus TaxID=670289 RepID=A0A512B0R6_9BACT|nr:hypothetical protein [Adhaeribacter aerolatus]GEO05556.1 hypothetical protein AAE02nite_32200 [Adhaeribacter aerolatus]